MWVFVVRWMLWILWCGNVGGVRGAGTGGKGAGWVAFDERDACFMTDAEDLEYIVGDILQVSTYNG